MSKPVIVCVDDELAALHALRAELKARFGGEYAFEIAESGEVGLRLVQQLALDRVGVPLVITDQLMPGMRGDALLAAVRQISPDTRGILLSGQTRTETLSRALNEARVDYLLVKPWDSATLTDAVAAALSDYDRRRAERERLDLIETAADAARQLAAAEALPELWRVLLEIGVSYSGAFSGAVIRQQGESLAVMASSGPERSLFSEAELEANEPVELPAALLMALGREGGWRAHPQEGSAEAWALDGVAPAAGIAIRLWAGADESALLLLTNPRSAFHRNPAPLLTRLLPQLQPTVDRLSHLARLTHEAQQLAENAAALETSLAEARDRESALTTAHAEAIASLSRERQTLEEKWTNELAAEQEARRQAESAAAERERQSADAAERSAAELATTRRELESVQQSLNAREAELAVLRAQSETFDTQARQAAATAAARIAELEAELDTVSTERRKLITDVETLSAQLGKSEDSLAALKASLETERTQQEQRLTQQRDALKAEHAALQRALDEAKAETERQRQQQHEELARQQRALQEAQQGFAAERNELRNQILGLTAQVQGAGRPQGEESGPLREQLQALALKLADTEAQLEDVVRQAASSQRVLSAQVAPLRRYFPQSAVAMRPGRPYLCQSLWSGGHDERLWLGLLALPTSPQAVQQLAWLQGELLRLYEAALDGQSPDPHLWRGELLRGWRSTFEGAPTPAVGLCLVDTELPTLRYVSAGARLLLLREGKLIELASENEPPAETHEGRGLLLEAGDVYLLGAESTLPAPTHTRAENLCALLTTIESLPIGEQQTRLDRFVAETVGNGYPDAGYAVAMLRV